jgi:hypothetical protein
MRNPEKTSAGKPHRKKPLGKSRYRWEYNVRMDLG